MEQYLCSGNKLGRYEQAIAACEQALHFKPDFELARNNLNSPGNKLLPAHQSKNGRSIVC